MTSNQQSARGGTCPICGRPTETSYRPFCSRRCADVDLSRWLSGAYAIPDAAEDEERETSNPSGETADSGSQGSNS